MNPDPVFQRWRELGWRRPFTTAEQAEFREWLRAHPEAQADGETELALNQALARLPDAPVPTNFTSRVWQAIEQDAAVVGRSAPAPMFRWWRELVPRFALASVVVGAGLLAYHHQQAVHQLELAKLCLATAESSVLTDPKVIEDFEVIRQLRSPTVADEELLKLME